jgi:photosystem II stability/assembly factor-like uncharacterized protein
MRRARTLLLIALIALAAAPGDWSAQGQESVFNATRPDERATSPAIMQGRVWMPNVKANQDDTRYAQHEPHIAASLTNPDVVVVAAKDYRVGPAVKQVWIYVSRDGGITWPRQLHMPGLPDTITRQSDPVVIARDDGRMYVACLGYEPHKGLFLTWSDDDGETWVDAVRITDERSPGGLTDGIDDKEWVAVDNSPQSRSYHNMYTAYTPTIGNIYFTRSTDEGKSWSTPVPLAKRQSYMAYVVVAADGDVFVFYYEDYQPGEASPLVVRRSTDGGQTFGPPVSISPSIPQPTIPIRQETREDRWRFFSVISAAADPMDANRLYIAWSDPSVLETEGMQVVISHSSDGGASWSLPERLSHDPTGVVRDHITPVIAVGPNGQVHAMWLDRRDDPENRLFHAYYTSSTDGGETWEADRRVSTHPFDLNIGLPPISRNAAGDYWGLAVAGDRVYAAWTDTRNRQQDIYTARLAAPAILP